MNRSLITVVAILAFAFAGCEVQSEMAKKSVEDYQTSPTPARVQQAPAPIDPADVVNADTTKPGPTLFANENDEKKSLNCKEYNRVMINGSRNEVTITGVCGQIIVNGQGNKVAAVAAGEIVTYGSQNEVTYTKIANGRMPIVTDSSGSNTVSKVAASEPAKKK